MKKFDWKKFRNEKIAVHCKTEEEAKDFCKKMHEQGMKWNGDGNSFLEETKYRTFQEETCYSGTGCFCPYDYYKENKYTILEWSDYMRKEFTKADLKDGMVVEYRDGKRRLVVADMLIGKDGFLTLNSYSEELKNNNSDKYTIVKTYKISGARTFAYVLNDNNLELIWERTETKHMTVEEMRVKLEELTGEKIEIEPSREEMLEKIKEYCCGRTCRNCCIFADCEKQDCSKLDGDKLKQCYEKVMEDGNIFDNAELLEV